MLPCLFVSVTHIQNPSTCDLTFKKCFFKLQYAVYVTTIYPPSHQSFHNYLGPTFLIMFNEILHCINGFSIGIQYTIHMYAIVYEILSMFILRD